VIVFTGIIVPFGNCSQRSGPVGCDAPSRTRTGADAASASAAHPGHGRR
jgi:hypothetical protein